MAAFVFNVLCRGSEQSVVFVHPVIQYLVKKIRSTFYKFLQDQF